MVIDWSLFIGIAIGVLTGLPIGYFLGFKRVETADGEPLLVPTIDTRAFRQRLREANFKSALRWGGQNWLIVILVCIVLTGVAQMVSASYHYRTCTDRLWETIDARSAISADTETARRENDQAAADWAEAWLSLSERPNAPNVRAEATAALQKFVDTYNQNAARQEANARARADKPFQRC